MEPQMNTDEHRWSGSEGGDGPRDRNRPRVTAYLCSSVFICGFLFLSAGAQAQTLYKCVQAGGRVQYQQEPCADAMKQSTVRPPDPVAPKSEAELRAAAESAAKAAELEIGQVGQVIADASLCTNDVPEWDEKHGRTFQQWKNRNGTVVAKFDADPQARARAIARMDSERARFAADKPGLAASCEGLAARLGAAPAAGPKP
jgi:hypothetical protein